MRQQRAKLGMAMLVLTESIFFFMLILAFVYFRAESVKTAAASLNPVVTAIYTACLIASSFTMWRAKTSAARDKSGARLWLGLTIALGIAFLAGQGSEYLRLLRQGVTISQGLFGTTFFTLTGIHGLHVVVGLLLLAILFGITTHRGERESIAVEAIAMYWYFVDAVWIVIFSVVYLWTFV
jgi:heme/copper-type cytochrome/quinol oxidase subunit 3